MGAVQNFSLWSPGFGVEGKNRRRGRLICAECTAPNATLMSKSQLGVLDTVFLRKGTFKAYFVAFGFDNNSLAYTQSVHHHTISSALAQGMMQLIKARPLTSPLQQAGCFSASPSSKAVFSWCRFVIPSVLVVGNNLGQNKLSPFSSRWTTCFLPRKWLVNLF